MIMVSCLATSASCALAGGEIEGGMSRTAASACDGCRPISGPDAAGQNPAAATVAPGASKHEAGFLMDAVRQTPDITLAELRQRLAASTGELSAPRSKKDGWVTTATGSPCSLISTRRSSGERHGRTARQALPGLGSPVIRSDALVAPIAPSVPMPTRFWVLVFVRAMWWYWTIFKVIGITKWPALASRVRRVATGRDSPDFRRLSKSLRSSRHCFAKQPHGRVWRQPLLRQLLHPCRI